MKEEERVRLKENPTPREQELYLRRNTMIAAMAWGQVFGVLQGLLGDSGTQAIEAMLKGANGPREGIFWVRWRLRPSIQCAQCGLKAETVPKRCRWPPP
jgi:hypothetical protein